MLLPSLTRFYLVLFGTYKLTIFAALRTKPKKPRLLSGIALLAKFATAYKAVKPAAATGVRPTPASGNSCSMFCPLNRRAYLLSTTPARQTTDKPWLPLAIHDALLREYRGISFGTQVPIYAWFPSALLYGYLLAYHQS